MSCKHGSYKARKKRIEEKVKLSIKSKASTVLCVCVVQPNTFIGQFDKIISDLSALSKSKQRQCRLSTVSVARGLTFITRPTGYTVPQTTNLIKHTFTKLFYYECR